MKTSKEIDLIALAFFKAQTSFKPVVCDCQHDTFRYKYASLHAILEACKGALHENKISILQTNSVVDGVNNISETVLLHDSGQWILTEVHVPTEVVISKKGEPIPLTSQSHLGAITSARRTGLTGITGLCSEEKGGNGNGGSGDDKSPMPNCPKCNLKTKVMINRQPKNGKYYCIACKNGFNDQKKKQSPQDNAPKLQPTDPTVLESMVAEAISQMLSATDLKKLKIIAETLVAKGIKTCVGHEKYSKELTVIYKEAKTKLKKKK